MSLGLASDEAIFCLSFSRFLFFKYAQGLCKVSAEAKFTRFGVMGTGTLVHSLGSMNLSPMIILMQKQCPACHFSQSQIQGRDQNAATEYC